MPTHQGFRLNNDNSLQDREKPAVKPDQKQSIDVGQIGSATDLASQHRHLITKCCILSRKPTVRLERCDHNTDDDAQKREHCALTLRDFVNQSMRMSFRYTHGAEVAPGAERH